MKEHPQMNFSHKSKKLNDFIIEITSLKSGSQYVNFHIKLYQYICDSLKAYDKVTNVLTLLQFKNVNELGRGRSFGEVALNKNCRRNAKIICSKNSIFCILQKEEFQKAIEKNLKLQMEQKIQYLREFKIFQKLS